MTESNAKIMKIVLSLLAIVSVVLIVVFAVGGDKKTVEDDGNYEYVEDGDDMLNDFSGDDLNYEFNDLSGTDTMSDTDVISGTDA